MNLRLFSLICFNIFGAINTLSIQGENITAAQIIAAEPQAEFISPQNVITPQNIITPQTLPAFSPNGGYFGNNIQPLYPSTGCSSGCGSSGQCPSYCSQAPGLCSSGCQSQQIQQQPSQNVTVNVPVRVSRIVPEKITRPVQKISTSTKVSMVPEKIKHCPRNYKMVEDELDGEECVENEISCPSEYELRGDKCIRIVSTCANEHLRSSDKCTLRLVCPMNYRLIGNECVAADPQCPYSWTWNGKVCIPQRFTCPSGYILGNNEQCTRQIERCPPTFKEYGDQCIKDEPVCGYDFIMNKNTNVCEKTVNKCPKGSFEQNGECLNLTYSCPPGTKEQEDFCVYEQTSQKIIYEIKYVPQTMIIPAPAPLTSSCGYGGYGCNQQLVQPPCTSGCPQNIQQALG